PWMDVFWATSRPISAAEHCSLYRSAEAASGIRSRSPAASFRCRPCGSLQIVDSSRTSQTKQEELRCTYGHSAPRKRHRHRRAVHFRFSEQGGIGVAFWQRDGRELYYLAADRGIMAVPVTLSPDFEFGKAKLLFRPPESMPLAAGAAMISRDGERVLVAVPPPQLPQLTVFYRQGKFLSTVGQPAP